MGWTSYYRPPGEKDIDHLRRELFSYENCPYELLAGATVRNVFYGAVRTTTTGEVWALVVLQHRNRGESRYDGSNYARKEIEGSMGPAEDRCPARILDMLTAPTHEYDTAWRARCRENLAKSASQPSLRDGLRFRVATPWTFADDVREDTFTVVNARRRIFRRACDGRTCRLPAKANWPAIEVLA